MGNYTGEGQRPLYCEKELPLKKDALKPILASPEQVHISNWQKEILTNKPSLISFFKRAKSLSNGGLLADVNLQSLQNIELTAATNSFVTLGPIKGYREPLNLPNAEDISGNNSGFVPIQIQTIDGDTLGDPFWGTHDRGSDIFHPISSSLLVTSLLSAGINRNVQNVLNITKRGSSLWGIPYELILNIGYPRIIEEFVIGSMNQAETYLHGANK